MRGMKSRTVRLVLRKKIDAWLDSIEDPLVKEVAADNVIITGGAIVSLLLGEAPNDYDLYLKDRAAVITVANYYVRQFNLRKGTLKTTAVARCNPEVREVSALNIRGEEERRVIIYMKSAGVAGEQQENYHYFEGQPDEVTEDFMASLNVDPMGLAETMIEDVKPKNKKYRPVFFSDNAISLSDKVQVIIRFHGEPKDIHRNYDYAHTTCSYDYKENELILPQEALVAIMSKNLIYRGSLYPIASIFRLRKFIDRGWRISAGEMLKIMWQINRIDLDNHEILRDQLIGVDSAYMGQLISALKNAPKRVDDTYLAKLIDEIFE